jgi:hypothetical protein
VDAVEGVIGRDELTVGRTNLVGKFQDERSFLRVTTGDTLVVRGAGE